MASGTFLATSGKTKSVIESLSIGEVKPVVLVTRQRDVFWDKIKIASP